MVKRQIREISRSRNLYPVRENIYISCEGDAEEAYLFGLKIRYSKVATIKVSNSSPRTSAPDVVENLKKKYGNEYEKDDLKYCVFDCDDNTVENLKKAKKLAKDEGAKIIFSNPCFEIWLLWHYKKDFSYQDSRDSLKKLIENYVKPEYWNCKNNPNLYEITKSNIDSAQKNSSERKIQLEEDIDWYSRESNPYSNFSDLIKVLSDLEQKTSAA